MFCKRWRPEELLPKVDSLACLLLQNQHITGVALTGSLARLEPQIHDIDLVVFHDGEMQDGSSQDPPKDTPSCSNELILGSVMGEDIARSLGHVRGDVPINYIFVGETALWDCRYLQELEKVEMSEKGRGEFEFYLTILCQIPLMLLSPSSCRGGIKRLAENVEATNFGRQGLSEPVIRIRHWCDSEKCRPIQPWAERSLEIKRRKGHTWHD